VRHDICEYNSVNSDDFLEIISLDGHAIKGTDSAPKHSAVSNGEAVDLIFQVVMSNGLLASRCRNRHCDCCTRG